MTRSSIPSPLTSPAPLTDLPLPSGSCPTMITSASSTARSRSGMPVGVPKMIRVAPPPGTPLSEPPAPNTKSSYPSSFTSPIKLTDAAVRSKTADPKTVNP